MIPWRWMLENTLVASGMAMVLIVLCRYLKKHPALCHVLWLLVLVRLVMPPLPVPSFTSKLLSSFNAPAPVSKAFPEPLQTLSNPLPLSEPANHVFAFPQQSATVDYPSHEPQQVAFTVNTPLSPISFGNQIPLLVILLWVLGGLVIWVRQGRSISRIALLARQGVEAPPWLKKELQRSAQRMAIEPPRLKVLPGIGSPFVWGFGRATLFWPEHQARLGFSPGAASVLAHELAHLRRYDHLTAWLQIFFNGLLWWNPIYWTVRNRLNHYAEMACDAWAVWTFPRQRRAYAEALIDAADPAFGAPLAVPALGAYSPNHRNFKRRLTMILQKGVAHRVTPLQYLLGFTTLLLLTPGLANHRNHTSPSTNLEEAIEKASLQARAHRAMRGQDYETSAQAWREMIRFNPENPENHHRLGDVLLKAGDYRGAVKAYSQWVDLGDNPAHAWMDMARAYAAFDQDKAIESLERALNHGMTDAQTLGDAVFEPLTEHPRLGSLMRRMMEAERLLGKGRNRNKSGQEALDRLMEIMPDSGKLQSTRGYAALSADDYQGAIDAFSAQIERNYNLDTAWYNLACAQSLAGRTDEALDSLKTAMDLGFDNIKHIQRDSDLDALRQTTAFQEVMDGFNLNKNHDLHSQGIEALKAARYDEALSHFEQQAISGHNVSWALYNMACALALSGRNAEALNRLEQAIEAGFTDFTKISLDEDLSALRSTSRFTDLVRRADNFQTLAMLGATNWEDLESKARRAIQENPEDGSAYLKLGWSLLRQNRERESIPAFEKQLELDHIPHYARYNLACAYARLGDSDKAFDWLDAAIEIGQIDFRHVLTDQDMANLRGDVRFDSFVTKLKNSSHRKTAHRDHHKDDHHHEHEED